MNILTSKPVTDLARDRLLRTAELLFAVKGIDQVTLRELTAAAQTNVAAVNYHFGSKAALIESVFDQLALRVNKERLKRLEAYLETAAARGTPVKVGPILDNFLEPYFDSAGSGRLLARLILQNRVAPTRYTRNLIKRHFDPLARRHVDALMLACPGVRRSELVWRYSFMIGAVVLPLTETDSRVSRLSDSLADTKDQRAFRSALMRFLTSGIGAPG